MHPAQQNGVKLILKYIARKRCAYNVFVAASDNYDNDKKEDDNQVNHEADDDVDNKIL